MMLLPNKITRLPVPSASRLTDITDAARVFILGYSKGARKSTLLRARKELTYSSNRRIQSLNYMNIDKVDAYQMGKSGAAEQPKEEPKEDTPKEGVNGRLKK